LVGGVQGIMVDPESGVLMGGADPRRDGYAIGW
jgi:gamma-glutamyltranspeptidase/glutathione hydrolase